MMKEMRTMGTLINDIKYGFRMLWKNPGFTIVAVLTLALGIGVNTAIFSMVNSILLRPLPFKSSERLIYIRQQIVRSGNRIMTTGVSYLDYCDWRQDNQIFEDLAAFRSAEFNLVDDEGASRISSAEATSSFFSTLEVSPYLGRVIQEDDERPDAEPVVLLSYSVWKNRFGGRKDIVGQSIRNSDKHCTVIGVLPRHFEFPPLDDAELWTSLIPEGDLRINRTHCAFDLIGRLKPGISMDQAQRQINILEDQVSEVAMGPKGSEMKTVACSALHDFVVRGVRTILWILYGIVGFILLIACANVANLCLVRASARDREMSVRSALGASRGRLFRQLITETLLLGLLGGIAGLCVGYWSAEVLRVLVADLLPRVHAMQIDIRVILFSLGLSLLVGLGLGLVPYSRLKRTILSNALKERGTASKRRIGLSQAIVTGQIALALVLTLGTGLMIRSLVQLMRVDTGFNPACVTTFRLTLPEERFPDDTHRQSFCNTVLERIKSVPGVVSCALDTGMPFLGGCNCGPVNVPGREKPEDQPPMAVYHSVSPEYFDTLQILLLQGERWQTHIGGGQSGVAVINQRIAELYWPNENPIGQEVEACGQRFQIVGVTTDLKQWSKKLDKNIHLFVPYPTLAFESPRMKIAVRTVSARLPVIGHIRSILKDIDPTIPLHDVQSLDMRMNVTIHHERFATAFLTTFAVIALLLTVVGIYGIVSFFMRQRFQEIGIRMALGAGRHHITGMIFKQGFILAVFGCMVGVVGALGLTGFLSSYLYEISATDPVSFVVVPIIICAIILAACWIPAQRAAKIDPIEALRYE
jgi:putative ABC transport system permease protein